MKLKDIPRLLPGATVRVKMLKRYCVVTLKHEGREASGVHRQLTFATRRAALALGAAS